MAWRKDPLLVSIEPTIGDAFIAWCVSIDQEPEEVVSELIAGFLHDHDNTDLRFRYEDIFAIRSGVM